jgi:CRP/FNR family transcriptional regulator, cyclic AMP receptor protein
MRATSKALPLEEKARISPVGIKKLSTGCDPETFLEKVGFGKTVVNLKEKEAVFLQGDPANAVFYIQKGRVKLTVVTQNGKEATIALLGAGGFIGEGCMASAHPRRMATAAALTECTVLKIDREEMLRVLHREHAFSDLFVSFLLARNIRFEADLVDQLFNCCEKRLARVLLLLSKFGKTDKAEAMIPNISQETLAGMVGTTRARVSFFMNRFRKSGFIDYHGGDALQVHNSLLNVVLQD